MSWIYAIGVKMNALMPVKIRPGVMSFRIHCILLVIVAVFMYNDLHYLVSLTGGHRYELVVIIAFTLIYFYLLFSVWMFASRMLESMVKGYFVNRSDALKSFFYFWIFFYGVWYIQPAVQRVLAKCELNNA
jgi:phosphotransferase system  glucose/maltose/N-acetylglucosamine-specific IIC component